MDGRKFTGGIYVASEKTEQWVNGKNAKYEQYSTFMGTLLSALWYVFSSKKISLLKFSELIF